MFHQFEVQKNIGLLCRMFKKYWFVIIRLCLMIIDNLPVDQVARASDDHELAMALLALELGAAAPSQLLELPTSRVIPEHVLGMSLLRKRDLERVDLIVPFWLEGHLLDHVDGD